MAAVAEFQSRSAILAWWGLWRRPPVGMRHAMYLMVSKRVTRTRGDSPAVLARELPFHK
jgi:hypothetical protein